MTSPAFRLAPSVQRSRDAIKVDCVKVGSSGLIVSWPILGGVILGSSPIMPWNLNEEDSIKLLKAAYDRGLNTWDTANCYGDGLSEEIIGKALQAHQIPRHKVVIMTKTFFHVGERSYIHPCNEQPEGSLRNPVAGIAVTLAAVIKGGYLKSASASLLSMENPESRAYTVGYRFV